MSEVSQKFPLRSIPPVFCESHQHDLHRSPPHVFVLPAMPPRLRCASP